MQYLLDCHLFWSHTDRHQQRKRATATFLVEGPIINNKGRQSTSPQSASLLWVSRTLGIGGTESFQLVRFRPPGTLRMSGLSPFSPPGTLGTVGTQPFQAPKYPGDWRDSVLSGPQVSWGLEGLSPFRPPEVSWKLAGFSPFRPPRTLGTCGTQSLQGPRRDPGDWQDSVLSGPQVPCGL